jgi:hypothetical protein
LYFFKPFSFFLVAGATIASTGFGWLGLFHALDLRGFVWVRDVALLGGGSMIYDGLWLCTAAL